MIAWWYSLSDSIQAAFISAGASLITALFAAGVVGWQVAKQSSHAIEQNRKNEETKIKASLYEKIIDECEAATNQCVEFENYLRLGKLQLSSAVFSNQNGQIIYRPSMSFLEINRLHHQLQNAAIGVFTSIEKWNIIDKRMSVFKSALGSGLHDLRTAFFQEFTPAAVALLPPPDPATGHVLEWNPPGIEALIAFDTIIESLIEASNTITSYVSDYQTAMQNALLGGLFPHRLPARQPIDPKFVAVTLEDHERLETYFAQQPWGIAMATSEQGVRDRLKI